MPKRKFTDQQFLKLHTKVMELRRKTGWGRVKIARKLGISENTVGNWLYSKNKGRKYHRDWERKHRLTTTNHRKLVGKKRPYPIDGTCEMCLNKSKSLDYHHWDDTNLTKGLWICKSCHINAEWLDHGNNKQRQWIQKAEGEQYIKRYIKLKKSGGQLIEVFMLLLET